MRLHPSRLIVAAFGIPIWLLLASCSSAEPTTVPTSTPTARQVYTDSFGIEWELLGLADDAVGKTWATFVESIGPSGEGYPGTAVAAEAALNTYVQRSTAMQEKLKTITPPPGCERLHILFSEVAGVGVESARVMQEIVDDGFFAAETTRKIEVAMAQVSSVASDLGSARRECR